MNNAFLFPVTREGIPKNSLVPSKVNCFSIELKSSVVRMWSTGMWFHYSVSCVHSLSTPSPSLALSPLTAEMALGAFMGRVGGWSEKKALLPCSTLAREVNMIKWPSD